MGVACPSHLDSGRTNGLGVEGGEDEQENPAFPVELGNGQTWRLVVVWELYVGRRPVGCDVKHHVDQLLPLH